METTAETSFTSSSRDYWARNYTPVVIDCTATLEEEAFEVKSDRPVRHLNPKSVLRGQDAVQGHGMLTSGIETVYTVQDLFENRSGDLCEDYQAYLGEIQNDEDFLIWILELVSFSPTAFALIRKAAEEGWNLGISDLGTGGFHLDIPEKQLFINHFGLTPQSLGRSPHYRNTAILTLIRGLRDIWQESRFGDLEKEYRPEAVLMIERIRAADSDTLAVLISWELRAAGLGEIWRYLLGSEEGDMALAFSNTLDRDPHAFMNGSVLAQVFRQWFSDETRISATDHQTLETLDMVLDWAEHEETGRTPFGDNILQGFLVEQLSCLPGGKAYLHKMGDVVCSDPVFASLEDPINEAHLFQIVHDLEVTLVGHVPFRDRGLARRIFPDS